MEKRKLQPELTLLFAALLTLTASQARSDVLISWCFMGTSGVRPAQVVVTLVNGRERFGRFQAGRDSAANEH